MRAWLSFRSSGLNTEPTGGKGFASQSRASMLSQLDVFTIDEIARAAGVPRAAVQRLVDSGDTEIRGGFRLFRYPRRSPGRQPGPQGGRTCGRLTGLDASLRNQSPRRTGPFRCRVIVASWGAPRAPDLVNLRSRRHGGKGRPTSDWSFWRDPALEAAVVAAERRQGPRSIASSVRDHKRHHPSNPNLNHFRREH